VSSSALALALVDTRRQGAPDRPASRKALLVCIPKCPGQERGFAQRLHGLWLAMGQPMEPHLPPTRPQPPDGGGGPLLPQGPPAPGPVRPWVGPPSGWPVWLARPEAASPSTALARVTVGFFYAPLPPWRRHLGHGAPRHVQGLGPVVVGQR